MIPDRRFCQFGDEEWQNDSGSQGEDLSETIQGVARHIRFLEISNQFCDDEKLNKINIFSERKRNIIPGIISSIARLPTAENNPSKARAAASRTSPNSSQSARLTAGMRIFR